MAGLNDAFVNGLSAVYNAEKLITEAMPKLMDGVQNPQTKQVMQQHAQETQQQQQRLEQIFQQMGQTPNDIQPDGILGIIKENEKIQSQGYDPATLEANVVAAAQRVEHYEIAGYGTLVTWAQHLGNSQAADLLQQTLQEEKSADQKLTQAAESSANPQAAQAA
jgi:ferritin-like metal-binding protein YciE